MAEIPQDASVQVATSIQQGPNGEPWVAIHVITFGASYAFVLSPDAAGQMAEHLGKAIAETVSTIKQQASGITVAQTMPTVHKKGR